MWIMFLILFLLYLVFGLIDHIINVFKFFFNKDNKNENTKCKCKLVEKK